MGLDPSQISHALKLGMGDRWPAAWESKTGKPAGWMDEVHLFSTASAQDLGPLRGKAVVVSPFGHRMVPVVTYDEVAEWIIAKRPYPVTERTEVDCIRMKRGGEHVSHPLCHHAIREPDDPSDLKKLFEEQPPKVVVTLGRVATQTFERSGSKMLQIIGAFRASYPYDAPK